MNVREHLANKLPVYLLVVVLGALMSYYYFVFVPQNEQRLNEHADRLLDNKAKSVIEKYKGYDNAIATAQRTYFLKWYFRIFSQASAIYFKEQNGKLYFSQNSFLGQTDKITRSDFRAAVVDSSLRPEIHGPEPGSRNLNIWQVNNGNFHFIYEPSGDFVSLDSSKIVHPYLWLSIEEFTSNLKSNDFFSDLFLLSINEEEKTAESSISGFVPDGSVLDRSKLGLVRFAIQDSIKLFGTGFFTIKISGQFYKSYVKRLKLKRGLDVYLVGLVSQSEFHRQASEVPAWFVVFCLLLALMLLFLLPVLKLFSLNRHERLSAADARLSVISMILCSSLVTIIVIGSYIFWVLDYGRMDTKLAKLSQVISDSTHSQVQSLQKALAYSSLLAQNDPIKNLNHFHEKNKSITKFNEVFSLTVNGKAGSVTNLFDEAGTKKFDFNHFPVQLNSREYYQNVVKAVANGQKNYFYIQFINSFTSGQSEVAISTFWPKDSTVKVITSRLPSIIKSIIPSPFKFAVINKKGDTQFHSEWSELQSENFVSECHNNPTLVAHLENDIKGSVEFTYLKNECRGYSRHLIKDWYLIVYYELRQPRNLAAEIFSLCLLSLGLVMLCSGLIHFFLLLDREQSGLLKTHTFFYHWLNPQQTRTSQWWQLIGFNLILFTIEMIWLVFFRSIVSSIFFIFFIISVFYLVSYSHINKKRISPKLSRAVVCLIIIVFIWLVLFLTISIAIKNVKGIFFIITASLLLGLAIAGGNKLSPPKWWCDLGNYFAYKLFLLSVLFVIAVGPAWIFISEHYYFSSLAHQYSQAYEEIKKAQIKSVVDNPLRRGIDYTDKKIEKQIAWIPFETDHPDLIFYRFAQNYQVAVKSMADFKFDFLPNDEPQKLYFSPTKVKVEAPASLLDSSSPIIAREREVSHLQLITKPKSVITLSLAILVIIVFWRVLREIPRKIFFALDKVIWKSYPERKIETFLEREFENDDEERHPLYKFSSTEKQKLIAAYHEDADTRNGSIGRMIRDKYILALQESARKEYDASWASCSDDEKYFLYDLSVDGVANQADQILIGRLAEKGLIRLTPRLEPVNLSFANYVLNVMNEAELSKWKEKEERDGNWNNLRTMFIIIIAAAFIFLSIAEEDFAGRVAALAASVGLLFPRIISLVASLSDFVKSKV